MSNVDFLDCLEEIGLDPDIPLSELPPLLARVLEIVGPASALPPLLITRLGRLATRFSEKQLQKLPLEHLQVMEALGREQDWNMEQLQSLAHGFLSSSRLSVQDLDAIHLVTLGYAVCGLQNVDMEQLLAYEFCSAVLHLGSLALKCTEQQLYTLTRLCTYNDIFGPVSEWTEDIFREMGSVAAGLDDLELSALVKEQIQGLSPLAVSLIHPKKFAVVFSTVQLSLFSWSQAVRVTDQQWKLLDKEQQRALSLVITGDANGTQDYRASNTGHCSLCCVLVYCPLLSAVYQLLTVTFLSSI
ncbi:stereocilin-like [Bombina bombina]|uniref:stereocilin-like n=1 Tax=Bombina bombina TaxID=8345 RepID=UPI00235AB753|nr:stereocilin-like [Bombina bombina]